MVIINISCWILSRLTALSLFPIPSSIVQVFSLGIFLLLYSCSWISCRSQCIIRDTLPTPPTPNTNTIVSVIVIVTLFIFFNHFQYSICIHVSNLAHTHTMNLVQLHSWSCSCSFISISSSKPIGSTITWLLYKYRIVETDLLLLLFHTTNIAGRQAGRAIDDKINRTHHAT